MAPTNKPVAAAAKKPDSDHQHNKNTQPAHATQAKNQAAASAAIYDNSNDIDKVVWEAEEMSSLDNDLSNNGSINSCINKEEAEENMFLLPSGNPIVVIILNGRIQLQEKTHGRDEASKTLRGGDHDNANDDGFGGS
jgi:hypothetical protein